MTTNSAREGSTGLFTYALTERPNIEVSACMHPYIPLEARYRGAVATFTVTVSGEPIGTTSNIGATRASSAFQIRQSDFRNFPTLACRGREQAVVVLTVLDDRVSDWLSVRDEKPVFVRVSVDHDEKQTLNRDGMSQEEIERRRSEFREEINKWPAVKDPEHTPF